MRKLKKQWIRMFISAVSGVLTAGSLLCGCARQELTKTISLSDTEEEKGIPGIIIKNIQEYTYDGHSEDNLRLAWGEAVSNTVCQLRYEEEGYFYRRIDIDTKKTISKAFVDERMIFNMQIAPGGRYISYEAETAENASPELILFLAEEGKRIVLREWDECRQEFSYVWSDDGTKLFSWQNGDNYAFRPDTDWCVTCYDMATVMRDGQGNLSVKKTELRMDGSGYALRHVLPNADGSKVYVREEYESFSDSKAKEYLEKEVVKEKNMQQSNVDEEAQDTQSKGQAAKNWLLTPEKQKKKKIREYINESVWPVKYTNKGLYCQNEEGKLLLVEDVEGEPSVRELFRVSNMEVSICRNGDHIFLVEWTDDMQNMQLSGVKLEGTEPTAKQVLYKDSCEGVDFRVAADDSAVVLQGYEYQRDDQCLFKIMELGY